MRPYLSPALGVLILAASTPALRAQRVPAGERAVPASAPISRIVYDVTFDATTARRRQIHVAMSFATESRDPVVLSLPAWTPGAY
jgi:Peptidase M61 N-terminal domain